jgi:hypothetical protein
MVGQETPPQLQRPELGIETIAETTHSVAVTQEHYPWLTTESLDVPLVRVKLAELETEFLYGSMVSGNHSVAKLASEVPPQQSASADQAMFKGLTMLLQKGTAPNLESVAYVDSKSPLYKTTKRGHDVARLFFTVINGETPVVLRVGIASHKKQEALTGILNRSAKRRKKDG